MRFPHTWLILNEQVTQTVVKQNTLVLNPNTNLGIHNSIFISILNVGREYYYPL